MTKLRVLLVGAKGRMGQAILAAAVRGNAKITAALDQGDDVREAIGVCDVLIDFSHPSATDAICGACLKAGKALVMGTTGQTKKQEALIKKASKVVPIVFSPNFSVGVNALFWLAGKAAEILGESFDIEITEMHHRMKKDAPSGTAKKLAEILCEIRKREYATTVIHGREGLLGERPSTEIGIHSIRGGDVVGDHAVIFASAGERVELTHRASSRQTFALGALRAAQWVVARSPGLYSMQDVLGI